MMSAADDAYAAAVKEIRRVREMGRDALILDDEPYRVLNQIPDAVADLQNLRRLILTQTAVADLAPLAGLTKLQSLSLNQTAVADLAPLARLTKLQSLRLTQTTVADLAPLARLTKLQSLRLTQTAVADLAPLASLTALQILLLNGTDIADLAPLAGLVNIQDLTLDGTQVIDLRPVKGLAKLGTNRAPGLSFISTPATVHDARLAELAAINDTKVRAQETRAYLNTLPPWPQPYLPKARPNGQPPQPIGRADPPLTLEALIEAQDLAGWRFSPIDGALALYIRDLPLDQRQDQLARLAAERCAKLLSSLGGRTNSGGLRQDVWDEAGQFARLLSDDSRSLSDRSLDLWGSLIAIGDLLEANERGRRDGRDKLDLLPDAARAALSTFLAMASNLVRSFPEARALDDDHGGFARRGAGRQLITDILQDAVRSALVSQDSATLIGKVAAVAAGEGTQADKASTVSVKGLRNLLVVTALIGSAVGGIAGGMFEDIGGDVSDHFGLGEKAIDFLDGAADKLDELFDALPPDEAANLRARLQDYQAGRNLKP
jgi:hypothetical protein